MITIRTTPFPHSCGAQSPQSATHVEQVSPASESHTPSPQESQQFPRHPCRGLQCASVFPQKPKRLQQYPLGHGGRSGPQLAAQDAGTSRSNRIASIAPKTRTALT